jgi:Pentapeptide repeats (8 copies)
MPRRVLAIAALVILATAVYVAAFVAVPRWVVQEDHVTPARARALSARNDARTAALTTLGGLVVVLGAFLTLRTVRLTRQAQVTDRFGTAIAHLSHADAQVRVAGIYSLERIARESRADRRAVLAILGDHLRTRCPALADGEQAPLEAANPDVAAVAAALRRLPRLRDAAIDLSRIDLRAAPLNGAQLRNVNLRDSNLAAAMLEKADLRGANLVRANLRGASVQRADFRRADLTGADLTDSHRDGAKFGRARTVEARGLSARRSAP